MDGFFYRYQSDQNYPNRQSIR